MNDLTDIHLLENLGFHKNEASIYLTFMGEGDFSPSDAAKKCDLSRPLVYRALEKLKKQNLSIQVSERPKRYIISDPRLTLGDLISEKERKIEQIRLFLPQIIERYSSRQRLPDSSEHVLFIHDMGKLANLYYELMSKAEFEVLAFMKPPYHGGAKRAKQDVEAHKEHAKKNKIIFKGLYELENGYYPFPESIEDSIENTGEEVRMAEVLPVKAMIFDEHKVMMLLTDERPGFEETEIGLFINDPSFAKMQKAVFNQYWEKSEDYFQWKERIKKSYEKR